jgi:TPR repeat protein
LARHWYELAARQGNQAAAKVLSQHFDHSMLSPLTC